MASRLNRGARRLIGATVALVLSSALVACGADTDGARDTAGQDPADSGHASESGHGDHGGQQPQGDSTGPAPGSRPLRPGERFARVEMSHDYTPSAPLGEGTDDYRCFLLDPKITDTTYLTGTNILPGNPEVVHHVILFSVPPSKVAQAQAVDDAEAGDGWTCFGGSGLEDIQNPDDSGWVGAWAPGSKEAVFQRGYGIPLEQGSRIVMQVHYNLLAGALPDTSAAQLRLAPGGANLKPVFTRLFPGPVELPCRPGHDSSPLCDRATALADVKKRFGNDAGSVADLLHFLCGNTPHKGPVQRCERGVHERFTIIGVAGHMHLLGREISVTVNPGTPRAKVLLDIKAWDFDDQGAVPIKPVTVGPGDTIEVTCRHDQSLRDLLPAFDGQPERWVLWGEGTTDEMCLGILQVTQG